MLYGVLLQGAIPREYMISHQTDVRVNENRVNEQGCFFARKQMYDNSCGAASLLCAAKELGVDKIPQYKGAMSEMTRKSSLDLDNRCERDLYLITSGNYNPRIHKDNIADAGYSMPDKIVMATRLLGLNAYVVEESNIFSQVISFIYPDARDLLIGMGCNIVHQRDVLSSNQRVLEAVAVSFIGVPVGLHWVLCRPDGSYMDPAVGENYSCFSTMELGARRSNSNFIGYTKIGISIVITNEAL